ncbi:unnamed protein product [Heligmosomoides polygyrus]|uniref:Uncharacterized protein n=1 Tax=Heligmosomoides polygyrus TaxID=6339 RepID=A0A183FPX9_HELPZ|nr:unnamed protein product [Heligmosomoides polygyrus]
MHSLRGRYQGGGEGARERTGNKWEFGKNGSCCEPSRYGGLSTALQRRLIITQLKHDVRHRLVPVSSERGGPRKKQQIELTSGDSQLVGSGRRGSRRSRERPNVGFDSLCLPRVRHSPSPTFQLFFVEADTPRSCCLACSGGWKR